jgi:hypothetical protein
MKNLDFTPKERELHKTISILAENASKLLNKLEHGTPQFYQARFIACELDGLLDKLQTV